MRSPKPTLFVNRSSFMSTHWVVKHIVSAGFMYMCTMGLHRSRESVSRYHSRVLGVFNNRACHRPRHGYVVGRLGVKK
jgi:hypothetical protein